MATTTVTRGFIYLTDQRNITSVTIYKQETECLKYNRHETVVKEVKYANSLKTKCKYTNSLLLY